MKRLDVNTGGHEALIANSPSCVVRFCKCGMVHVSLGTITLHLTRDAFESVCATMTQAAGRLAERDERRPALFC